MNRSQSLVFRLLIAALAAAFLGSVTASLQAQHPPPRRRKRLRLLKKKRIPSPYNRLRRCPQELRARLPTIRA
jgi:hypothetical protein